MRAACSSERIFSMLIPLFLFVAGLLLLIKGGDWFVDGASGIAHRFKMSELIIGATIVSVGTTLPEVMVSATSALQGHGALAYGNAVGSIICNAALIAAFTMVVRPSKANRKILIVPTVFFFLSTAVYLFSAYYFREFSRLTGALLLCIFLLYLVISVAIAKRTHDPVPETAEIEPAPIHPEGNDEPQRPLLLEVLFLILGGAAIAIGADLLVDNGQILARELGIPEVIIGLIFVSLGTSLPELITAITALIKGHASMSLGNIIGANILNLSLVSGLASAIRPFDLPAEHLIFGIPSSLVIDLPVMLAVMLLLTVPTLIRNKVSRAQGILLMAIYLCFCVLSFIL